MDSSRCDARQRSERPQGHYDCRAALDPGTGASAAEIKTLTSWEGGATGIGIRDSARLSQIRMTYDDRTAGRDERV